MSFENLSIHLYLVVKEQKNQSINYGVDEVARNFSQNAKMDWEMDQVWEFSKPRYTTQIEHYDNMGAIFVP